MSVERCLNLCTQAIRVHLRVALGLEDEHVVDDVAADVGHHLQEQVVALQLVLHQRVALRRSTKGLGTEFLSTICIRRHTLRVTRARAISGFACGGGAVGGSSPG